MLGQVFVVFVLTIAAAESAIGLAILSAFYKLQNSIEFKLIKISKVKI
jgi:NADH:ubiquinone oxidoreductase subunit K